MNVSNCFGHCHISNLLILKYRRVFKSLQCGFFNTRHEKTSHMRPGKRKLDLLHLLSSSFLKPTVCILRLH